MTRASTAGTVAGLESAFVAWFTPGLSMLTVSLVLSVCLLWAWWFLCIHSEAFVEAAHRLSEES